MVDVALIHDLGLLSPWALVLIWVRSCMKRTIPTRTKLACIVVPEELE